MAKRPTPEMIAEGLTVPERIMLFCVASGTDWQKAGVTHMVAQQVLIRGLIDRRGANSYVLTDQGRIVLEALLMKTATRVHREPDDRC